MHVFEPIFEKQKNPFDAVSTPIGFDVIQSIFKFFV